MSLPFAGSTAALQADKQSRFPANIYSSTPLPSSWYFYRSHSHHRTIGRGSVLRTVQCQFASGWEHQRPRSPTFEKTAIQNLFSSNYGEVLIVGMNAGLFNV